MTNKRLMLKEMFETTLIVVIIEAALIAVTYFSIKYLSILAYLIGVPAIILIFGFFIAWISNIGDTINKYTNPEGYRKQKAAENARRNRTLAYELEQAEASQRNSSPWGVKYYTSPCPYCGHYKVRNMNWDDKRMSVAFWGAYAPKVGKHYTCDNCKQYWA